MENEQIGKITFAVGIVLAFVLMVGSPLLIGIGTATFIYMGIAFVGGSLNTVLSLMLINQMKTKTTQHITEVKNGKIRKNKKKTTLQEM